MAGSPWRPSWTFLTTKAPIVDYLGTCRFHLNSRTARGVRRRLKKKPIKAKSNGYLLSVHSRVTPTRHTLSRLWSALCCLLVSSAVSIANRLALAAKLLLQTITKELTLQCATVLNAEGSWNSFISLVLVQLIIQLSHHLLNQLGYSLLHLL